MMFLVIYEDHGKDPEYLAVCYERDSAKRYISRHVGTQLDEEDFEDNGNGYDAYILGDAAYVIRSVELWNQ